MPDISPEAIEREVNKSKLDRVRESLAANKDVVVIGEIVHTPASSEWGQTVDIFTAPKKPVYNAKGLNQILDNLVGIPNSMIDRFHEGKFDLNLGKLYFDEVIGVVEKYIRERFTPKVALDLETIDKLAISQEEKKHDEVEEIKRRTWVRLYPDEESARFLFDYQTGLENGHVENNLEFDNLVNHIPFEKLRKMQKGRKFTPVSNVSGFLKAK